MKPLQDSNRVTLAERDAAAQSVANNFKRLSMDEADAHLSMLRDMLRHAVALTQQEFIEYFNAWEELGRFVEQMAQILEAILSKNTLDRRRGLADLQLGTSIDPTHSGFPVFVRDFHFLRGEQAEGEQRLANLPTDEQLVEDALFSLFRGVLPADVIDTKLERNYYRGFAALHTLRALHIYAPTAMGESAGFRLYKLCMQRLEENRNLPRFYVVHLRVTNRGLDVDAWLEQARQAVARGFQHPTESELKYLARYLEDIEGVQVDTLERVDIGPFYNRHTQNEAGMADLLDAAGPEDSVLLLRKFAVQRMGGKRRRGLRDWLRGWWSGDREFGVFSQIMASPAYALMPHRLIQKVHHYNIRLGPHVRMFGLSNAGGLVD